MPPHPTLLFLRACQQAEKVTEQPLDSCGIFFVLFSEKGALPRLLGTLLCGQMVLARLALRVSECLWFVTDTETGPRNT